MQLLQTETEHPAFSVLANAAMEADQTWFARDLVDESTGTVLAQCGACTSTVFIDDIVDAGIDAVTVMDNTLEEVELFLGVHDRELFESLCSDGDLDL